MTNNILYPWLEDKCNLILDLYKSNKMPNVILLHGPNGIGKKELSLKIAKEINNNSYNLIDTDSIKIDQIRDLISKSNKTDYINAIKLNIIFDINNLTESSSNALLKVLEDYQKNTYFILTCNNKADVLPTLLSRCFTINISLDSKESINKSINWLTTQGMNNPNDINLLLDFANYGPLLAFEYYNSDMLGIINKLKQYLEELNKSNIQSTYNNIVKLFHTEQSKKLSVLLFIKSYYYIVNKLISFNNKEINIKKLNDLITMYNKNNNIALDDKNVIFNMVYSSV